MKKPYYLARRILSFSYHSTRLSWPIWFHLLNRKARDYYRRNPQPLDALQQRLVNDLKTDGISALRIEDLLPGSRFEDYSELAEQYVRQPENQARIQDVERGGRAPGKYFNVKLWKNSVLDLNNRFVELCLNDQVLGIVSGYLGLSPRLIHMNLWYNVPTHEPPILSQNWHRDSEDKRFLKIFLYLRDVDEGAGPFNYIPGSQDGGRYGRVFPRKPPIGSTPATEAIEARFPANERITYTGQAGTIIFCDTGGLHKGGYATERPRLLFTAMYLTDGAIPRWAREEKNYSVPDGRFDSLSPAGRYAIYAE